MLRRAAYLKASTGFIWSCAPFIVSSRIFLIFNFSIDLYTYITIKVALASFTAFVLSNDENVLDAETVFASLAVFNLLRNLLTHLPPVVSHLVQVNVNLWNIGGKFHLK